MSVTSALANVVTQIVYGKFAVVKISSMSYFDVK